MSRQGGEAGRIDRIVFFGTPEFAVPTLDALVAAGRAPSLVVSQPARPVGRGRGLAQPPVAARAEALALSLLQPERLDAAALERIAAARPDVAVVVAFGMIFPDELLALPPHGCVNLHASLLPRHRGAAPIQAAIAAGDRETGVVTMVMEASLDTGPVLLERRVAIGDDETAAELAPRLAAAGAELTVETVDALESGSLEPTPQDSDRATYARRIKKRDGRVDWRLPARRLYDRWRAYTPWPGLTASLGGRPVKIVACRPLDGSSEAPPGTVVAIGPGGLETACGDGNLLAVERLQRPGRRALEGQVFARGEHLEAGASFDPLGG